MNQKNKSEEKATVEQKSVKIYSWQYPIEVEYSC